jgi:hypothetical protein
MFKGMGRAAAAALAIGIASPATAALVTIDFEDGIVGATYVGAGVIGQHFFTDGEVASGGSNKYLEIRSSTHETWRVGPYPEGPGPGVHEQELAILKSFEVFVVGGGDLYISGFPTYLAPDAWTHFESDQFNPGGVYIRLNDFFSYTARFDNFVFESGVFSSAFIPEPATWAIMTMGLGAAGWVARRRRRVARMAISST